MSPIGFEIRDLTWRTARRSAGNGACVEVGPVSGQILVRDSMDRNGPVLQYSRNSWYMFVVGAKSGRFDPNRIGHRNRS